MQDAREARTRTALEITTSILLGLVSVATAIGAYQAGAWSQESSDLASVSQQARDRNFALYLEKDAISDDDGTRLFDAIGLYAQGVFYPERAESLEAEEDLVIAAGSPALISGWAEYKASGYDNGHLPLKTADYEAFSQAEPQAYNVISALADRASNRLLERSYAMTIVSVVFAVALLLLGVAGASSRLNVSAVMTGGGAFAFLIGVAIVIFGVF